MFRVIHLGTQKHGTPEFFMLCDERTCGIGAHSAIDDPEAMTNQDKFRDRQNSFMRSAVEDGWVIGLDQQLCPTHAAAFMQAMEAVKKRQEEGRKIVQPAGMEDVLKWNGKGMRVVEKKQ